MRQVELIEQEQTGERVGRQRGQQVFIQKQTSGVVRQADGYLSRQTHLDTVSAQIPSAKAL